MTGKLPRGLKIIAVSAAVTLLPIAIAILASAIGDMAGCSVNEGGTSPCVIAGADIGGVLATMFVMGWLTVLILPLGSMAILVGILVLTADALKSRKP